MPIHTFARGARFLAADLGVDFHLCFQERGGRICQRDEGLLEKDIVVVVAGRTVFAPQLTVQKPLEFSGKVSCLGPAFWINLK